jgi:hypothetical protein
MSRPHEEFEMLTAFAAMNQLSDHECGSLNEHLQSCASCRLKVAQMKAASDAYFAHHQARSRNKDLPPEVSERFSRRLASLGILPNSACIVNPVRSLRVAVIIVALAILAPAVAGVLALQRQQTSSVQAEIAVEQPAAESHAVAPNVFNVSRRPETYARHRRPRHSEPRREVPSEARELNSAEERLPHFRLEYPAMFRRTYPEQFAVPSVPSFPVAGLDRTSNGTKTFELASLAALAQSDTSVGPNALRFISASDLAHPGSISARPQFNLPPLTDGSLFFMSMRH